MVSSHPKIARQMKIRDLGGLIVIDFISMGSRKNLRRVEMAMKNALKFDKARHKIGRISYDFGLLTISRQRIRDAKDSAHFVRCGHCQGSGKIPSVGYSAMEVLRKIEELASLMRYEKMDVQLPHEIRVIQE